MKPSHLFFLGGLLALMFSSCVTRRACNNKFPPTITTETNTVIKDSTVYRDTTIVIPGDTVTITDSIPCPNVNYQKTKTSTDGRTKATVKIKNGVLTVKCETDSLLKVISNLQYQLRTVTSNTIKTIKPPPPIFKIKGLALMPWVILIAIGIFLYINKQFK